MNDHSYIHAMRDALNVLRALADPARLRVVALLLRRELCVCELMFILRAEQSRLSHQLRTLRNAGLVEDRREGRWIIYRVPKEARRLLDAILAPLNGLALRGGKKLAADRARLKTCLSKNIRKRGAARH